MSSEEAAAAGATIEGVEEVAKILNVQVSLMAVLGLIAFVTLQQVVVEFITY